MKWTNFSLRSYISTASMYSQPKFHTVIFKIVGEVRLWSWKNKISRKRQLKFFHYFNVKKKYKVEMLDIPELFQLINSLYTHIPSDFKPLNIYIITFNNYLFQNALMTELLGFETISHIVIILLVWIIYFRFFKYSTVAYMYF